MFVHSFGQSKHNDSFILDEGVLAQLDSEFSASRNIMDEEFGPPEKFFEDESSRLSNAGSNVDLQEVGSEDPHVLSVKGLSKEGDLDQSMPEAEELSLNGYCSEEQDPSDELHTSNESPCYRDQNSDDEISSSTAIKNYPLEKSVTSTSLEEEKKPSEKHQQHELTAEDRRKIEEKVKELERRLQAIIEKNSKFDLPTQIKRSLRESREDPRDVSNFIQASRLNAKPNGRPENIKKWFKGDVVAVVEKHLNKRASKKEQRSDAENTTVMKAIYGIPDALLKHNGSKCQYKSKKINTVLRQYLLCFKVRYLKFFELDSSEVTVKHFLDFIVLSFPENKVIAILNILEKKAFLSHVLDYKELKAHIVIRRKSSMRKFNHLFETNSCLQNICKVLHQNQDSLELPKAVREFLNKTSERKSNNQ